MRKQFIMLIVTAILLIMGWTIVEYLIQTQIQYQYKQISTYPVMVYSWDETVMDTLKVRLKQHDFIRNTVYKSSEQSASDMVEKYGLDDAEEILQDKALPDMLIIYLKGNAASRDNKLILKDMLDKYPDKERIMVEYQNDVWNYAFQRVDALNQVRWILIVFIALVIFLVFLLKRLHYEHHLARIRHLIQTRQKEGIKIHDHYWSNTLLLSLLPVLISFFLYQILYTSDWLIYSIGIGFFLIALVVTLAAALVAYPFVLKYKHEEPVKKEEQ